MNVTKRASSTSAKKKKQKVLHTVIHLDVDSDVKYEWKDIMGKRIQLTRKLARILKKS